MAESPLTQWEYRVEDFGGLLHRSKQEELQAKLNSWGEEGWEIVATVRFHNSNAMRFIAKRPLTSAEKRKRSMPSLDASLFG
jgi:hypothetical protein